MYTHEDCPCQGHKIATGPEEMVIAVMKDAAATATGSLEARAKIVEYLTVPNPTPEFYRGLARGAAVFITATDADVMDVAANVVSAAAELWLRAKGLEVPTPRVVDVRRGTMLETIQQLAKERLDALIKEEYEFPTELPEGLQHEPPSSH